MRGLGGDAKRLVISEKGGKSCSISKKYEQRDLRLIISIKASTKVIVPQMQVRTLRMEFYHVSCTASTQEA